MDDHGSSGWQHLPFLIHAPSWLPYLGPGLAHPGNSEPSFVWPAQSSPSSLFLHATVSPLFTEKAEKPSANCVGLKITTSLRSPAAEDICVTAVFRRNKGPLWGEPRYECGMGGIIAISPGESPC